jgi:hypothetical protein
LEPGHNIESPGDLGRRYLETALKKKIKKKNADPCRDKGLRK